jgi:GNAT superfamily N-acetyltransferase
VFARISKVFRRASENATIIFFRLYQIEIEVFEKLAGGNPARVTASHHAIFIMLTRTDSPLIRLTIETDFDTLIALATASGLFEPDQTEILAGMLRSPNENDVWFTDDDGSGPVGVAYMAPEKMTYGTWNLYWIAVHPDRQRNGRGKAILDHVENWLIGRGERILLVETAGIDEFEYVRNFYAKNGFEAEARIRDFYDSAVDKVVFRKVLNQKNSPITKSVKE